MRSARSTLPVLLEGETGTGKTYLACTIHELGPRSARPFVRVDCAELAEGILERELFGHERGAYTDARESGRGLIEDADGGTLLLDEICDLPLSRQSKLLTFVEEGWIRHLGGTRRIHVDARLICASNRDLQESVRNGTFRKDLYYRCCGVRTCLPPLRHRRKEIPAIVTHLLQRPARDALPPPHRSVEPAAMRALTAYAWPGNIRELDHVVRAAVTSADAGPIGLHHLLPYLAGRQEWTSSQRFRTGEGRKTRYTAPRNEEEERHNLVQALLATTGNRTQAAKRLGMSRQVLWERIRYHRIQDSEWRQSSERTD